MSIEVIWSALERASTRLSHSIGTAGLEKIARPTWFIAELRRNATSPFESQLPKSKVAVTLDGASDLAADIRLIFERDDLNPLLDLPKLVEEVFDVELGSVDHALIGGCCATFGRHQFMYVSRNDEPNSLYMCARQLGHLLLQIRSKSTTLATIELMHENHHAPLGHYKRFADQFALELLIPTRGLGVALQEVRSLLQVKNRALGDIELLYMARIFNVGFLAMARRCERAHLLPKGGAHTLNTILTEKYGSPERRASNLGLPERPTVVIPVLPRSVVRKMKELAKGNANYIDEVALQLQMTSPSVKLLLGMSL